MNVFVDACVWIDYFNPRIFRINNTEKDLLCKLMESGDSIYLCPTTYQEVLQGIRDDKMFERIKGVLRQFPMSEISFIEVTNYAINLYRHLRKKGITIRKANDCLVASYAIMEDAYLLHRDSDFTQIAKGCDLKIYTV